MSSSNTALQTKRMSKPKSEKRRRPKQHCLCLSSSSVCLLFVLNEKPENLVVFTEAVVTVPVASGLVIKSVESDVFLCLLSFLSLLNYGFQVEGRILVVAA